MSDPAGDLGLESPMDPFDGVHDLASLTKRAAQLWPERVAMLIDQTGEEVTFRSFDDVRVSALHGHGVWA